MGDVAMTVPVIRNVLQQHPELEITVVSAAFLQPLFDDLERCHFYPAFLKGKHAGIKGMYQLFKELKALQKFDAIADLHGVLRSMILTMFFKLSGYKTATINKGREGKKLLTQKENKILKQLPTSFERYAKVFEQLGFSCNLENKAPVYPTQPIPEAAAIFFKQNLPVIGVAPFAFHQEKMYPIEKMKTIVQTLSQQHIVLLFGGKEEAATLELWQDQMPGKAFKIAGTFSFAEELAIISNCSTMISMDSANMHLASLYGIPVVSIWGATHPFAGFYGWAQPLDNIVSINLFCRPCSVFGNKPCWRGDHACMQGITEKAIIEKVTDVY